MALGILRRKERGNRSPVEIHEANFVDSILPEGLDLKAILKGMQIAMQNGQIRTAIERVSEAMRPIIVHELLGNVPNEILDRSARTIEEEVPRLPSTRTIKEADGDMEMAAAISAAQLVGLVMGQYTDKAASSANGHQMDSRPLDQISV